MPGRLRIGFVILAHDRLDRAAALARHLVARGAPVVVHVDRRTAAGIGGADFGSAEVLATRAAEWGMFGLVEATLDATDRLLAESAEISHVLLASESCLPIRPVEELGAFLEAHPGADFIESTPLADGPWVQGGLSAERFSFWFPVPWKRNRRLFDALVDAQRLAGVRRSLPDGVVPHLGSQWWCLSARTLRRLLADPRLPRWRAFFRRTWIPDEGFFQSLVRTVGDPDLLQTRSLTLARFDHAGTPHVFHDDHGDWLAARDHFMARKIDPDAAGLRARFLEGPPEPREHPEFVGAIDVAPFDAARAARLSEPVGLQTQSRYPSGSGPKMLATARPWGVVVAADAGILAGLAPVLRERMPGADVHGRLFAPGGAELCGGGHFGPGNLPGAAGLRDYRPEQFLARLIYARRDRLTIWHLAPGDTPRAGQMAVRDANARIVIADDGDSDGLISALRGRPAALVHASVTRIPANELERELGGVPGPAVCRLVGALEGRQECPQ